MIITNTYRQPLYWGIIHGLNDLAAGYMLANFTLTHDREDSTMMLIIYAILGFGGQLPVGFFLDRLRTVRPFALASVSLLFLSLCCYSWMPSFAIILTGIAGAGVHVTGGTISLQASEGKAGIAAIFTAPGVLGLTTGGLLAGINAWPLIVTALALVIITVMVIRAGLPAWHAQVKSHSSPLDTHDMIMLGILVVMCFRSFIFDLSNLVGEQYPHGALILGLSAFGGKLIGGFVADKFGWRRTVYTGLILAFIMMQFGSSNIYSLAFGVACLQSSVPVTLMMMWRSLPLYPGAAVALSLGSSVAIAGLPVFLLPDISASLKTFSGITIIFVFVIVAIVFLLRKLRPKFFNPLFFYKK